MTLFLTLHTKYNNIEIALNSLNNNNKILLEKTSIANKLASSNLIPVIDNLLKNNNIKLNNLKFIIINAGPAPFTSLRTTIATANGLSFASKIPLVSICSIEVLIKENLNFNFKINIALLNAFGKDIYFAINKDNKTDIGVENIEIFMERFITEPSSINFIGNGTELYKNLIIEKLGDKAHIEQNLVLEASLDSISKFGLEKWQNKEISYKILPLYLKEYKINQ